MCFLHTITAPLFRVALLADGDGGGGGGGGGGARE